jgi:hypothetical protein
MKTLMALKYSDIKIKSYIILIVSNIIILGIGLTSCGLKKKETLWKVWKYSSYTFKMADLDLEPTPPPPPPPVLLKGELPHRDYALIKDCITLASTGKSPFIKFDYNESPSPDAGKLSLYVKENVPLLEGKVTFRQGEKSIWSLNASIIFDSDFFDVEKMTVDTLIIKFKEEGAIVTTTFIAVD